MKKILKLVIMVLAISAILCGCDHEMPMQKSVDKIVKIELLNEKAGGTICIMTDEDVVWFTEDLLSLECHKNLHPLGECGYLQIYMYYEDGNADVIGCMSNAQIIDGERIQNGWYYFDEAELLALFGRYTEPKS